MRLPRPTDTLAGCVWLPRIVAKARALAGGTLPPDYAARFGHASGVDGQFLRHFGLTRDDIVAVATRDDAGVAAWFATQPGATPERVAAWNHVAVNLGRAGFPMAERLPVALATTYAHLADRGCATVFEVLTADEAD